MEKSPSGSAKLEDPVDDGDLLNQLVGWVEDSVDRLQGANEQSELDRDYYDGRQWSAAELAELEKRGQPPTVSNHIQPKINYILGTEIKTRVDPNALPRTPSHEDESQACTDAMRAAADLTDFDHVRSEIFENMLIEGCGAAILEPDVATDENGEQDIDWQYRHIPWDQFRYDHRSKKRDFSDARWLAAGVWMDLDDALADPLYGEHADEIQAAYDKNSSEIGGVEPKPQLWATKSPKQIHITHMLYRKGGQWWSAHFTKGAWIVKPKRETLVDGKKRSVCRIVAAASYRTRATDEEPSWCYGAVRIMRDPQDNINKRGSKALWMLSTNQTWMEDGAITDPAQKPAIQTAVATPDSVITVQRGAMVEGRVKIERNVELAQGQAQLLAEAKSEIDRVGPSAPIVSGDTRVRSGRAELVQAQSSQMEMEPVFESMRRWQMTAYRRLWWAVRRSWTYEKWMRVRDDAEKIGLRFVPINRNISRAKRLKELMSEHKLPIDKAIKAVGLQPLESDELMAEVMQATQAQAQQMAMAMQAQGQQVPEQAIPALLQQVATQLLLGHPRMQEQFTQNKIHDIDVDIVLDVSPDTTTIQQEQFDKLAEMAGTGQLQLPPNVMGQLLIRASQLRNKQELLKLLETPPPDPMQQQAAQLQVALMQANVEKTKAQTMDLQAHAQQRVADAQFKTTSQAMKTEAQALEATANAGNKSLPVGPGQGARR